MNNKGFAITSIIYGLMLLFVLVVSSFLAVLVGRNRRMDELVEGVYETLEYPETIVSYDDETNKFFVDLDGDQTLNEDNDKVESSVESYVTPERGKYDFSSVVNDCVVYLPKNVVVITEQLKDPDSENNILYYKEPEEDKAGSTDVNDFDKELCR